MDNILFTQDIIGKAGLLKKRLGEVFEHGDKVAVKLHFGEAGNKTSLKPAYAKEVVSALKQLGARPFLFDSSTVYGGMRGNPRDHKKNAAMQGFTEASIGCPLVFSDDYIIVKSKDMDVEVCKPLADADGMLVLTHVKGHPCTGFGGAIKNLGMGGVTKKSKGEIHFKAGVEYVGGCEGCRLCEQICPADLKVVNNQPIINNCFGCDACAMHCPNSAFRIREKPFDELISQAAGAVIEGMKKVYYINVIKNITKHCDCMPDPGKIVMPDVGVLLGRDIAAIDKASFDQVNKKAGRDIFKEIHHKSPLLHIEQAEKLNMGSMEYRLTEVS